MRRPVAAAVSFALVGAVLEPLVRAPDDDGFPLSTFPMFALSRGREVAISYAQGAAADGRLRTLSPAHLGTGEVMQAYALLQRAVDDPAERAALCVQIAARVAADADYSDVIAIRLVTGVHDTVDTLAHDAPGTLVTRASCQVPSTAVPSKR